MVQWLVRLYGIELIPLCAVEDSQQVPLIKAGSERPTQLNSTGSRVELSYKPGHGRQNSLSEPLSLSQMQGIHSR